MADDDRPVLRISDDERDSAVRMLRTAVGEGRITLEEFSERTGRALAATTGVELAIVVSDLPRQSPVPASPRKATRWVVGILGGGDRKGRWRIAPRCRVVNVMGGADLDLRAATPSSPVTEITVFSLMGGSTITVPDGVDVELSGFALMGSNDLEVAAATASVGAPLVRVRAFSLMGGTDVKSG